MKSVTLGNRPATLAPRVRIEDFEVGTGKFVRVSLILRESRNDDNLQIDSQAFEVDATGLFVPGPDGRPSRTNGLSHVIAASALSDTHTLKAGWVRIVGDYTDATFEPTAPRAAGKPVAPPNLATNPTGQSYDPATGIGYRWDAGEAAKIAKARVTDMARVRANSAPLAGIDF